MESRKYPTVAEEQCAEIKALKAELASVKAALEFYAKRENYDPTENIGIEPDEYYLVPKVEIDRGKKAREALEGKP